MPVCIRSYLTITHIIGFVTFRYVNAVICSDEYDMNVFDKPSAMKRSFDCRGEETAAIKRTYLQSMKFDDRYLHIQRIVVPLFCVDNT